MEPSKRETLAMNHWVEESTWNPGTGYLASCHIYRKKDSPAFVTQQTSILNWNLHEHVPFVLVVDVTDSMRVLTDFRIESPGHGLATLGRFRSETGAVGSFFHSYEVDENPDGAALVSETVNWRNGMEEKTFDLKDGRIFVARVDVSNGQWRLEQISRDLPDGSLMDRLNGIDGESLEATDLLVDWWQLDRKQVKAP